MSQAVVPFVATVVFAFAVYRWTSDELGRERRLSPGAGNALVVLFVLLTSLVLVSSLGGAGRLHGGGGVALVLGSLLAAAGAALAGAAVWALGSRERLVGMLVDVVVADGPYRYARHPFYLGWTAALLGTAIAGASGAGLTVALFVGVSLARLARNEERFLLEELGDQYGRYRRQTPTIVGRPGASEAAPIGD